MFSIFTYLVLASFILRTVRQVFFQVYLWQLKEYRIDRMFAHLKTADGRKVLFSPVSWVKWLLLAVIYATPFMGSSYIDRGSIVVLSFYLFWVIWILEACLALASFRSKGLRYPRLTLKSISVTLIILYVQFQGMLGIHWTFPLLFGPVLDKLLAPSVFAAVVIVNIPFALYKNFVYLRAYKKIRRSHIKVVGITGSFGKTSTKEYLFQILTGKFKVLKTPGSFNTDFSIARFLLAADLSESDYLIAEMAAYRKGEIRKIGRLLHPELAIVTGIGNQHLELFGSTENLVKAKTELIDSLKPGDLLVISPDNEYLHSMRARARDRNLEVIAIDAPKEVKVLKVGKTSFSFALRLGKNLVNFQARLAGIQHLNNLVLAIKTAYRLGMSPKELKIAVDKLTPPEKTMSVIKQSAKLTVVDDTFNVNFEGVKSILDYLKLYKGKKVLFLNPIIELGESAKPVHREIGKLAGGVCDYLFLTNRNYAEQIREGISDSGKKIVTGYPDENSVKELIKKLPPDSVIALTGKESAKWIKYLT